MEHNKNKNKKKNKKKTIQWIQINKIMEWMRTDWVGECLQDLT